MKQGLGPDLKDSFSMSMYMVSVYKQKVWFTLNLSILENPDILSTIKMPDW